MVSSAPEPCRFKTPHSPDLAAFGNVSIFGCGISRAMLKTARRRIARRLEPPFTFHVNFTHTFPWSGVVKTSA